MPQKTKVMITADQIFFLAMLIVLIFITYAAKIRDDKAKRAQKRRNKLKDFD